MKTLQAKNNLLTWDIPRSNSTATIWASLLKKSVILSPAEIALARFKFSSNFKADNFSANLCIRDVTVKESESEIDVKDSTTKKTTFTV